MCVKSESGFLRHGNRAAYSVLYSELARRVSPFTSRHVDDGDSNQVYGTQDFHLMLRSFSILIASLFTLPPSTVIPVGWQSYAFLTGALIAPAAINVLFAISASVYVGLLTQTSRVCCRHSIPVLC